MGETIGANSEPAARRPRIPPRVLALLAVLLVVLVATVVLARRDDGGAASGSPGTAPTNPESDTGDPSGDSTDRTPDTSTARVVPSVSDPIDSTVPPAPIDPVDEPSSQDADLSVTNFLARTFTVINLRPTEDTSATGGTEGTLPDISDVVTGVMADEVLATANEFEAMGWTQLGIPEVVDVRVVRAPTPQEPLDAVVEVCLDSSRLQILDESGSNVRPADTPARSLNIFVLRLVDGSWLVAARTFPDDANC